MSLPIQLISLVRNPEEFLKTPISGKWYVSSLFVPFIAVWKSTGCKGLWFRKNLMLSIASCALALFEAYPLAIIFHLFAVLDAMAAIKWYNWNIKYHVAPAPNDKDTKKLKKDMEFLTSNTETKFRNLDIKVTAVEAATAKEYESVQKSLATLTSDLKQLHSTTVDINTRTAILEDRSGIQRGFSQGKSFAKVVEDDLTDFDDYDTENYDSEGTLGEY